MINLQTPIVVWFEYTYSDDEYKEEGIEVLDCTCIRRTLKDMNRVRYSDMEMRKAEQRQQQQKEEAAKSDEL